MKLSTMLRLARTPNLLVQLQLAGHINSFLRLHFLYAATDCGLLRALKTPSSKENLIEKLDARRPELLDGLLQLGVSLRELSLEKGLYKIRGKYSSALVGENGDPLAAWIEELLTYHASVYRHMAGRIAGAPLGDYLDETGDLIARSSRLLEPMVGEFVRLVVAPSGPVRILEVGCGSGTYLRRAAQLNPQVTGIGIDMQRDVVQQARANMERWDQAGRFRVMEADIRTPPPELDGPFDLITLYNNVYYFPDEERPALFRALKSRLAPGGRLALVTLMRGRSVITSDLDMALRSTRGCTPLPRLRDLQAQLRRGGFTHVESTRLVPVEPLYGLAAKAEL